MSTSNDSEYTINEELLRLIQPLSDNHIEKLKDSLINDRDMRVVHV